MDLLEMISRHRFVFAAHVAAWFRADRSVGYRRLAGLLELGLLAYEQPFHAQPGCYRITTRGLKLAGSELRVPSIEVGCYRHDAALVWLWLTVGQRLAAGSRLLSEREMRAHDRRSHQDLSKFALTLPSSNEIHHPHRHFPDLLIADPQGRRRAIELELTLKARRRLEHILLAYAAEPSLVSVTYITDRPAIVNAVAETATALGLDGRVLVQLTDQPFEVACPPGVWRTRHQTHQEVLP